MEHNTKRVVSSKSIFLCVVFTLSIVAPEAEARAFFVFGDSLVDNGNNNYLATTARADGYPYGIDSASHRASGRFSNGLNMPDLISSVFIISITSTSFHLLYFLHICFGMKLCLSIYFYLHILPLLRFGLELFLLLKILMLTSQKFHTKTKKKRY